MRANKLGVWFCCCACWCAACVSAVSLAANNCEQKCKKYACHGLPAIENDPKKCGKYDPWKAHESYHCAACHPDPFVKDDSEQAFLYKCDACDLDCAETKGATLQEAQGCDECEMVKTPEGVPVTVDRDDCRTESD